MQSIASLIHHFHYLVSLNWLMQLKIKHFIDCIHTCFNALHFIPTYQMCLKKLRQQMLNRNLLLHKKFHVFHFLQFQYSKICIFYFKEKNLNIVIPSKVHCIESWVDNPTQVHRLFPLKDNCIQNHVFLAPQLLCQIFASSQVFCRNVK